MASLHYVATLSVALLCCWAGGSQAAFINVPPPGSNFELVNTSPNGAIPVTVAYNAMTQELSVDSRFGGSLDDVSSFTVIARDIIGTFSLEATIDHSGHVLGGSFALAGQSATLGISSPRVLLSGNILDDGQNFGILQLSADVSSLDSGLATTVGPVGSAVLDFITGPVNFTGSFSRLTASESPDIFLVPEPPSGFVFAAGYVLWALIGRRRSRREPLDRSRDRSSATT